MSAPTARSRRTVLAVPGSSPRFLAKAQQQPVDEVFLDLEDAVAPAQKAAARSAVASALRDGDWGSKIRAIRMNDVTTAWAYRDVIDVVEQAGDALDVIVLPKVTGPADIQWLDLLLSQIEAAMGYPAGRIGIEAQIEDARGLALVDAIAAASPRLEALVFGPADFMASLGMRSLEIGQQPAGYRGGDAFHYAHLRILVAARAFGLQAVDGPHAAIHDADGPAGQRGQRRGPGLRREVGAAPGPGRHRQRRVLPGPGRLRPGRAHPGRLRVPHDPRPGRGHARR